MDKIKTNAWRLLAAIAVVLFIGGCSDGELASNVDPNLTPPAPMIISFYADPAGISAGQQTTVSWEVAGADSVEITAVAATGEAVAFGVNTDQLSGSESVTLASTTDFILTATKEAVSYEAEDEGEGEDDAELEKGGQIQFGPEVEEGEEPQAAENPLPAVSSVSQTITVTVTPAGQLSATITADQSSVAAGESTVIRWSVTPSDDLIAVGVVSDSGEAIVPTDQCEGDMATILAQPASEEFPAVGCAVVTPDVATNYTINAQDSAGNDATASTMVSVSDSDVTAKIYAAKDDTSTPQDATLEVQSWQDPVVVSWNVTPTNAEVTVVAEGSVEASTSAPCELPNGATDQAEGSTKCKLVGATKFTITATYGSVTDTDDVNVTIKQSGTAGLTIAGAWAFHEEDVGIEMKLDTDTIANSSVIENVLVAGQAIDAELLTQLKTGLTVKPRVIADVTKSQFVDVDLVYGGGAKASYKPVMVVDLEDAEPGSNNGATEVRVTSAKLKRGSNNKVKSYVGVMMDGFNGGSARFYIDGGSTEVPFHEHLLGAFDYKIEEWFFEDKIVTYPVAIEPVDADEDYVIVGVTGEVLRYSKDDEGVHQWHRMGAFPRYGKGNVDVDHPTCGRDSETGMQNIQTGDKKNFDGDLISMNQICDFVIIGETRLLVATDYGVRAASGYQNDKPVWMGYPEEDVTAEEMVNEYGFLTFSHVTNDLQLAGDKVYAATDAGVVVGTNGIKWSNTGFHTAAIAIDGNTRENQNSVWALAYDSSNEILYGGHEGGIKYLDTTGEGVDCSEDESIPPDQCGDGWKTVKGIDQPVISLAVDPASPSGTVAIFAGTPSGLMVTRDVFPNNGDEVIWSHIKLDGADHAVTAIAVDAANAGARVKYNVMIGSGTGKRFFRKPYLDKEASSGGDLPVMVARPFGEEDGVDTESMDLVFQN